LDYINLLLYIPNFFNSKHNLTTYNNFPLRPPSDLKDGSSTSRGASETATITAPTEKVIIAKEKHTTQDKNTEEG